jgi:hypothetical protein
MAELVYRGQTYRLRAGSPMPVGTTGDFVLHTFMAEVSNIDIYACTENLPASSQFRGQGGNLMSANFSRLNVKGGTMFSGKVVYNPSFVDEGAI